MNIRFFLLLLCPTIWLLLPRAAAQEKPAEHWAFQPLKKLAPPPASSWGRNPVDAFIHARQKSMGTKPSPETDRRTLLRRLHMDLTGLPPTIKEVEAFEKDDRPDAYERRVEKLLTSPQHGERWARHWLDVARWAESEGYESNHPRNFAWRFRDWVVRAFNSDKPFADFVREQIAGDEIEPYADENLIATGFLAACRLSSNEEDRYRQRNDMVVDIANATASAFLGLTLQCAQCHNHRIDPFSARDYYRFHGFFIKGQPANLALKDPKLWAEYNAKKPAGYDEARRDRDALFEKGRQLRFARVRGELGKEAKAAYDKPMEERTPAEERLARETDLLFQFTPGGFESALRPEDRQRYNDLKKRVADMETKMIEKPQTFGFYSPVTSPHALEVLPMKGFYPLPYEPKELARAKAFVLRSGDVHQPGPEVGVGWPEILGSTEKHRGVTPPARQRLALAEWLTSAENPLTARVFVNRLWHWHFGRGIVTTPNDFGLKGAAPTHPELLDWLAGELQRTNSIRHVHRLIVTSATYRQSARANAKNEERDPDNETWWRWATRRLEAEAIRDSLLAVSDELDRSIGGPSVVGREDAPRRSLYLFQKRDLPPQQLALFDGPVALTESCPCRRVTTVPLQALYLLNSDFSVKRAEALARRVEKIEDGDGRIEAVFRLVLQRSPDDEERSLGRRFFESQGEGRHALARFCQAVMNVNEFVYLE